MKVIAFHNLKGGVGKTAAAVNIAQLAADDGVPTLHRESVQASNSQ